MGTEPPASLGEPLESPPADGITALRFSSTSDQLLASSWDGTVHLYDGAKGLLHGSHNTRSPVLDCCFHNTDTACFSGGLDGLVKRCDFPTRAEQVVGRHEQAARCVQWLGVQGLVASASWDSSLRLWDPRSPEGSSCVGLVRLPGKAYTMSQGGTRLVVGTSNRQVVIYDLRSIQSGTPEQARESSLKYQTRCLACFPDGSGYALSSVEGRVAMEYFDLGEAAQSRKYAFKCHRRVEGGVDTVYPVNAIAFHPTYGTFATGGCDGVVNLWDGDNKKRLCQISAYPTSVAALAFSRDGSMLAVASSYTYERGERDRPNDEVYVRRMTDVEVRPKPRK